MNPEPTDEEFEKEMLSRNPQEYYEWLQEKKNLEEIHAATDKMAKQREQYAPASEMTKREHMATEILAAIYSRENFRADNFMAATPWVVAVNIADELLKELNKESNGKV